MCYHPIKIRNPALYFNSEIDKPFIEVPCGHCEQCAKNRVNDLVVRSYYEWQKTISKGGFCYFDTLTYNDNNVPRILGEMCFSRKHLTDFFKLVRKRLENKGFQINIEIGQTPKGRPIYDSLLKYLVTTEYGSTNSKRPHYHVLWFCSVPGLSVLQLYNVVRNVWLDTYHFGFNDKITDIYEHVVNRLDGIKYVCKYLTKSSDYLDRLQALSSKYKDDPKKLALILDSIKDIKPFYRSSIGFGSSIMDVDLEKLKNFGVPLYSSKGPEFYAIPRYIKYKLFYDKKPHPFKAKESLYTRNDLGVSYLVNNLDKVIDSKVLLYNNLLDNSSNYSSIAGLKDYILSLLDGRELRQFVIYKCIYKGHLFSDLSWQDYNDYYMSWLTAERKQLSPFTNKKCTERYLATCDHAIMNDSCNPDFFGFDEIDELLDVLCTNFQIYNENLQIKKKYDEEKTKDLYRRFFDSR